MSKRSKRRRAKAMRQHKMALRMDKSVREHQRGTWPLMSQRCYRSLTLHREAVPRRRTCVLLKKPSLPVARGSLKLPTHQRLKSTPSFPCSRPCIRCRGNGRLSINLQRQAHVTQQQVRETKFHPVRQAFLPAMRRAASAVTSSPGIRTRSQRFPVASKAATEKAGPAA